MQWIFGAWITTRSRQWTLLREKKKLVCNVACYDFEKKSNVDRLFPNYLYYVFVLRETGD